MKTPTVFLSIVLILVGHNCFAGPLTVGNGGGTGEFYLEFAVQNSINVLHVCQASPGCKSNQENVLQTILKFVQAAPTELEFLTSTEMGRNTSLISRPHHYQINKDLLFFETKNKENLPWRYTHAWTCLLGLWGKDAGLSDAAVAKIQTSISDLLTSEIRQQSLMDSNLHNFSLVQITSSADNIIVEDDLLTDETSTLNLNLTQAFDCENSSSVPSQMANLKIQSAMWGNDRRTDDHFTLQISGEITYQCVANGQAKNFSSRFNIVLPGQGLDQRKPQLLPDQIIFSQSEIQELQ